MKFSSLGIAVIILVLVVIFAITGRSQTISNDIRVSAGVTDIADFTQFTGNVEVRKSLSERFAFTDVVTMTTDGNSTVVKNDALVRFAPVDHFFIAGGMAVGKRQGQDVFVNPVVQTGVNFNIGNRLNVEPFVQLDTPDLASDNNARSLSGNVAVKLALTSRFGLLGQGSLRSTRVDNRFFDQSFDSLDKSATGGFYFNF